MAEIYIGDQQISGGGGTIDTSGFVDVSTWDEHEKVVASALVDLKCLEDNIEEFDDKIERHVEVIDTKIQTLDANKADSSVVYTKKDIDKVDKVTAAALASLDGRVSTLESSGGSGGSGEIFDPSYLEEGLLDVSTRVDALDTSIKALDASVKELASSGGSDGGSTPDLTNYIDYTTASNAGLAFGAQKNFIESITATNVTGTVSIVAGNMTGNFIYLDPVNCDISFSYNGDTGSINLMSLYDFMMNYN